MRAREESKPRAPACYARHVPDDDRERAIAAVVAPSRPRASSPRWLWALALLIGAGCAVAFVVAMVRGGDASSGASAPATTGGSGFPAGLGLGVGVGIAIGYFAARRAQPPADAAASHSSRKRP